MRYALVGAGVLLVTAIQMAPNFSITALGAVVLCFLALAYIGSCSVAAGGELVAILTGMYFVPASLINLTEGALFDVIKVADVPIGLLRELAGAIVAAVFVTAALGRLRARTTTMPPAPPWPAIALLWRTLAAVVIFILCYFVAGLIIYPFVQPYYANRILPPPGAIVSMQVLRSLALMVCAYPVVRTIPSHRDARLALSIALPVIGAIVPLLPANDLMPAHVRLVHALEVVPYYALFGFLLAKWFGEVPEDPKTSRVAA